MTKTTKTETVHHFDTSAAAWAFMRTCDALGMAAGFPSLKPDTNGKYTVRTIPAVAS